MHKIPNLPLGKVANRSIVRIFFPRMYHRFDSSKIPSPDIELIYNASLRPIIQELMPNQATHWPYSYQVAMETSRDTSGRLHLGSLDIPAHLLPDFASQFLRSVQELRPYFRDAYFGHELRGWKGATFHNLSNYNIPPQNDLHERVSALDDLTRVLDMPAINPDQWLIDIGLEFGAPHHVVTWRSLGHSALLRHLCPNIRNLDRVLERSKTFYIDHQMHLKDFAGFRWTPGQNAPPIHYMQAYTTEKSVSYQLHEGLFRQRKPLELLSDRPCGRLLHDLEKQSKILFSCTGDNPNHHQTGPQEGCARLEVRVRLSDANDILTDFPRDLINRTMVQVSARYWWYVFQTSLVAFRLKCDPTFRYFKWLRLGAVFSIIKNLRASNPKDRACENSLALASIIIWILNGAHRTPFYRRRG